MTDNVELIDNGRRYAGWKSIRVTQTIESIAGSFALGVSDRWDGKTAPWPIANEDTCRVEIDGEPVIDGYIDNTNIKASSTDRSLSYSGKDRSAALVENAFLVQGASGNDFRWSFRNMDLAQYFSLIAAPHNIAVSVQPGLVLAKTPLHVAHPGEKCLEAIKRAASPVGVLVVSDGAGGIVITRAGNGRAEALIEGVNIMEADFTSDATNRFASYLLQTQTAGTDDAFGASTQIQAAATDQDVRRLARIDIIKPEQGYATTAAARRRADWEARTRAAHADAISVTVQGWRQSSGELWRPNRLVHVAASKTIGVDGEMLISQVEFTIGDGGRHTQLHVVRPDAFLPEPQAVVSGSGAWKELDKGAL
jgi:prophage tail gpP-like protein